MCSHVSIIVGSVEQCLPVGWDVNVVPQLSTAGSVMRLNDNWALTEVMCMCHLMYFSRYLGIYTYVY